MTRTIILFCLLLSAPPLIQASPIVAFVDVNVIPMDKERVLLKGKYYSQVELDKWLDEIAPRFQHALDEK